MLIAFVRTCCIHYYGLQTEVLYSLDGQTFTFRTNQRLFFFFFFYNRKEQSAADSSGSGSSSRLCASAPASRVSARPRTCCMRIVTCPGRYSEIGQETLIDKSYLQLSFTVETENNIKDYHHSYHRTGCDLLQACNKSRSRQEAQIKIVLG